MTLSEWIRSQPSPHRSARSVRGNASMSDIEFAALLADPGAGVPAPTPQAVSLWRKGLRVPSEDYMRRIEQVTAGAVTPDDLRSLKERNGHAG